MTDYSTIDFSPLVELTTDEVVTHSFVKDIPLPSGKTLALVTLDNGRDHTRPNTMGPATLLELGKTFDELTERAKRGEIDAVAVTGKPFILAAGADLSKVGDIPNKAIAKQMAQLGHQTLGKLSDLGVPSFVFINGLALGGGLEIGLNADYRTVDRNAPAIALPEVFLGIIPGWGGAYLLPNLIGIENALKVIVENPLKNNRMLKGKDAFELGIARLFHLAGFQNDPITGDDRFGDAVDVIAHLPHRNVCVTVECTTRSIGGGGKLSKFVTRPCRARRSAAVLAAGQWGMRGCRVASTFRSLRAPQ